MNSEGGIRTDMKLLLYCTKAKPYLYDHLGIRRSWDNRFNIEKVKQSGLDELLLNGKIVAECDFEVEEILIGKSITVGFGEVMFISTPTLQLYDLSNKSCLSDKEIKSYLGDKGGYAIHIKNLHIFDEPIDIRNYYNTEVRTMADCFNQKIIKKAPQNMCNAYDVYKNHYVLISIKPQWLCKILNGEKTIEVRKKVLKEMLK